MATSKQTRRLAWIFLGMGPAALGAGFVETAERWLSYDVGRFVIKPQLGLTTRFTDNVFYGNNSAVQTNYPTIIGYFNGLPVVDFTPQQPKAQTFTNISGATLVLGTISTNVAPIRPVESEVFQILSPGLKLQYGATGLNTLTLDYSYDRIFYLTRPEFNTAQHRAVFGADLKLGRFTIRGTDNFQLLSSFLNGNNSGLSQQVDRFLWSDNYRITYDATAKTDIYLNATHSLTDYEAGTSIYDQESVRGTLGATYIWSDRFRFFVEGVYGHSSINPNSATQPDGPNSMVYGGFVGVRGNFTSRIQGNLKVGYESRIFPGDFPVGQEPASVGSPAVGFELSYAASEKTILKLNYDRSTDVSPQFGKQSYIYDRVRFTANQFIGTSGKWLAVATAGVNMGDFSDTPGVNQARTDQIIEGGLRLMYQPRPWLAAVLAYDYENYATKFVNPAVNSRLVDYQVHNISLSFNIGY